MRAAIRFPRLLAVALLVIVMADSASADIRLDPRVSPTSQSIALDLDANETEYTGSVRIELAVQTATSEFQFHAEEMNLDQVVLSDDQGPIGIEIEEGVDGLRTVTCERELQPGSLVLEIDFSKEFNAKSVGLYRITHEGQGYLFSQFQDVDARKAFPCWDEPIFKIPYQISVTIPIQQEAVSNTPVGKQTLGASTKTYHFKKTPPLPSYLLAIVAGPLESVAIPGLSVPGRVYTVKGQKHLTKLAAQYAPPILDALEAYFGREYPYEKLDLIAIPEFWPGAMENAGAVTYRDNILLVDPDAASEAQKRTLARVHAHEFAHMWFGDLVTMAWWDDLWLNESFADWMGDKIADRVFPDFKIPIDELQTTQRIMDGDGRASTVPVRKPVESTADLMDGVMLSYHKGKTVLAMVEMWIGADAFQEGVRSYIAANEWGSTVAEDLFSALSEAADQDLTPILSSFLEQPGYPTVALEVGSGGVISVSQKRFRNYGVEMEELSWTVPIRIKYSDGETIQTRSILLDGERAQIEVGSNIEWAMPNEGSYGYYRWTTPPDMLFKIADDPERNLSTRERAVFLSNAKALLLSGDIGGDEYLTLLSVLASYTEPEVVNGVMSGLGSVSTAFVTDDNRDEFAHYIRETLGTAFERYGMAAHENEPTTATLMRPRLIRWLGGPGKDAAVRAECVRLARQYMTDPNSIDASIAGSALRIAAIDGTSEDFDAYQRNALESEVPEVRQRFLGALGYFDDPALQDRVLALTVSGAVRPNEINRIVGGVSRTASGREKVFQWMMDNYALIGTRIPAQFMGYMPYFASGCSEERLARAREFFAQPEHNVGGTDKNLMKVEEQVTDCVNLRGREGPAVADYLSKLAAR